MLGNFLLDANLLTQTFVRRILGAAMKLDDKDLMIESVQLNPPGGQQVGVSSSGCKITHIPSGIEATSKYERSQHRNKQIALSMIEWGLSEIGYKQ